MRNKKYIIATLVFIILGAFFFVSSSSRSLVNEDSFVQVTKDTQVYNYNIPYQVTTSIFTIPYLPGKEPIIKILVHLPPSSKIGPKLRKYIYDQCIKEGIPYYLACQQIWWESNGWNIKARNYNYDRKTHKLLSIDYGLMQLNSLYIDKFLKDFKDPERSIKSYDVINNPFDNVQIGLRVLKDHYLKLGSWSLALQAYNAGKHSVLHNEVPLITLKYAHYLCPIDNWWLEPRGVKLDFTNI
jgi:soluble lytic murein transglycosylase-like protein